MCLVMCVATFLQVNDEECGEVSSVSPLFGHNMI
jgi:hypothetical protein